MADNNTTTSTGMFTSIAGWLKQPFNSGGSALNWVLFLGLVIIGAFFWNLVLIELAGGIEKI